MKVFTAIIKVGFKIVMQYKWASLVSLIADPIVLLINIALFKSIYAYNSTNNILGYSLSQMVWYFATVSFIWYLTWNFADRNMARKILSGNLATDLMRPVSVFKMELATAVSQRMIGACLEFFPSLILYSLLFYPDFMTPYSLFKFLLAVVFAFLLSFMVNYLVGLSAFIIQNNFALQSFKQIVVAFLAGALIPLEFLPDWFNRINNFLPFKYIFYQPVQLFLNRGENSQLPAFLQTISVQLLWIGILYLLCKFFWNKAVKKFCAVGG